MKSWKYFCLIKQPQFQRDTQTEHLPCKPFSSSCPLKLRLAAVGVLGSVCLVHLSSNNWLIANLHSRYLNLKYLVFFWNLNRRCNFTRYRRVRARVRVCARACVCRGAAGRGTKRRSTKRCRLEAILWAKCCASVELGVHLQQECFKTKIRTEPARSKVTPRDTWILKQISLGFTDWEDPALGGEGRHYNFGNPL